ncbi:hypothetical protein MSAN_01917800 [Mycena sanguinolenta]|uniref:Uncharacterized protein n=1 Tax=Mycena sanguinolenta TaxID=230812 RepID=A0A8H7CR22_9AGAR|nr:hypothetical protein MSAN_01917800 [Mycena sanguinolenta]
MAYGKPTKSEKNKAKRKERPTVVDGPQNAHYLKKHKPREEPVAYLPHRRTLIEKSGPPLDSYIAHNVAAASSDFDFEDDEAFSTYSSPQKGRESPTKKRHQANRENQNETWQREVIPALVPVFVKLWHRTPGLRDADALRPPGRSACACGLTTLCKISVVRFTGEILFPTWRSTFAIALQRRSNCSMRAYSLQLPRRPTFAADIRVLEFARNLFGRIAPNNTAWTATLESFLRDLGFSLDNEGSMRRMFASSLEWYTHLRNQVKCHFDNIIEDTRRSYLGQDTEDRDATPTPTPTPGTPAPQPVDEDSSRDSSSSPPPASRSAGKKRARETTPPVENPFGDPPPRTRPSEYLRQRCPACFGALVRATAPVKMDIHCCMDACFNQKRDSDSGTTDPPKFHPESHFIPESISAQMEEYVDSVRNTKPSKKRRKAADATEVLDACEASFKAADENRQKASSQFYDATPV